MFANDNSVTLIIILLIALGVVVLLFAVVDRILKRSGATKKADEKKTESKPIVSEKTSNEQISEIKSRPTMKIYNSELADDLNAMLKQSSNNESSRLQIENRKNRESNISKYIREKKYRSFDFGKVDDEPIEDDDNEPLTFSREDYKKFMALSNIKDKKPL